MAARDTQVELDAAALREEIARLQQRVAQAEERRRALVHIMGDLNESNRKLGEQRKAMLHILKDSHQSNLRLADSRKAMIHIMGDLRETTQEMERREQELREKQEQLVQAGKLATLGELTTGVAHELNNPLNNIGLFIGNALDQMHLDSYDEAAVQAELENAMEQVRKATAIISHLRTFGRPAPVSLEEVDVDEVIERSLSLMQEQLRLRAIDVELDLCAEELIVYGNAIQLEQVFINLLENAIKYSPNGGRIEVSTEAAESAVRFTVRDEGMGIPAHAQGRVFERFHRVDPNMTQGVGGTGLGLYICREIVEHMNGRIWVASTEGAGATFTFELPAAEPA
jgi:two-component system C4-dicarboxylate transport sensor histidine kinase DctB